MKANARSIIITIIVVSVTLLVSIVEAFLAVSVSSGPTSLAQAFSPQTNVTFALDDGTAEESIGIGGTLEFIFMNRFTPDSSQTPIELTQVQVFFKGSSAVVGDEINLVIYQDADNNPANGATLLYSSPTIVKALDTWNIYDIVAEPPLLFQGTGDILVGVIALEVPGESYYPAAIDLTSSQQRSWIGWWIDSPPPNPPALPPDDTFRTIDSFDMPGNWMIRAYGLTAEQGNQNIYLPVILSNFPPIPTTPELYPISNANGDENYNVNWSTANRATSYILQEDDNQAFSSPEIVYSGISLSWLATNKPSGTYYYRVKANNSWGDSPWSNIQSTTVVPPPPPQTTLYVTNDTGCQLCFEVQNTGIGQKCFSSGQNLYGTFPAGIYTWSVSTTCCGSTGGTEEFSAGILNKKFWCGPGQPSKENALTLQCEPE